MTTEAVPAAHLERPAPSGFDLRAWLADLRRLGEVEDLAGVASELEIGALTDLNAKNRGPALLFSEIKGFEGKGRLLSCSLSRGARLASALGLPDGLDDHALVEALRGKPKEWQEAAPRFRPRIVSDGPVRTHVLSAEELDVTQFPAPLWHEGDGGRYLGTGCAVITREPDSTSVNCGTYRLQVHDAKTLGLFIEPFNHGGIHVQKHHEQGQPAPVVVSFGHGPLVYLASSMPLPYGLNELEYAGAMAGEPIDVIEGELTGLPIPASSELAIEGWVFENDLVPEGPFGEFTGYFAGGRENRLAVRVERVYHRDDPIVYGSLPAKPPFDHSYWRAAMESALLLDELQSMLPDVRGAWKYETGSANFFTVVSIRQRYAGHAQQVGAAAALIAGGVSMGRYVIVVDDDIDVMDIDEVIWCISTRTDPAKSIQILNDAPTNPLDPMLEDSSGPWTGSRAVINACRPFHRLDSFGAVVEVSPDLAKRMREQWGRRLGWTK